MSTKEPKFLPAPIDGLNLVDMPHVLKPTEARLLDNFYVHDWGIQQSGLASLFTTLDSSISLLVPFNGMEVGGTPHQYMLCCTNAAVYRIDSSTDTAPGTVTGTAANAFVRATFFGGVIFLQQANGTVKRYVISTDTLSATGYTGSFATVSFMWTYKERMYGFLPESKTIFIYGGVQETSGAGTEVDVGTVLRQAGNLTFGASWSFNQGNQVEDLFVLGTDSGEVLVYSGDYPGATNWQLISRTVIPPPTGMTPCFNLGNELLIMTSRGLVELSKVLAGQSLQGGSYFNLTRKLGDNVVDTMSTIIINTDFPFMYLMAGASVDSQGQQIYVQNYERGAWSRLVPDVAGSHGTFKTMGYYGGVIGQRHLYIGTSTGKILKISDAGLGTTSANSKWKTPFFDFGTIRQKKVDMLRTLARKIESSGNVTIITSVSTEFEDPATPAESTTTINSATAGNYRFGETAPPGVGRRLSFLHDIDSFTGFGEIAGFEAHYSEGGVY